MNNQITIVFVSYFSKSKVLNYLKQFNDKFKVIIIENSKDLSLLKIVKKYKNVKVIINKKNIGFGASSNIGLRKVKTKYGLHLDLDTKFSNNSIIKLIKTASKLDDFIIIGPKIQNYNYKSKDYLKKNYLKNLNLMNFIDGCCLLFNMNKIKKYGLFDENFFLYYEETDLFKRYLKFDQKIFMTENVSIQHQGRSSSNEIYNIEIEINRNWHLLWSKFYYYKKHYNYFTAICMISKSLFSSALKIVIYTILRNDFDKKIYLARFSGAMNSILKKKSWYRPEI